MNMTRITLVLLLSTGTAWAQVTAGDVVDRPTLKAFVERAAALTEARVEKARHSYEFFEATFRPPGEWRRGSIYIFVITTEGIIFFNGAARERERRSQIHQQSVRDLIAAAEKGGGFVEYLFDNPEVEGDEDETSPKVAYAQMLDLEGRPRMLIGSGIYPATATPVAGPVGIVVLAVLLVGGAYRRRAGGRL